ncbi:hypothetical protein PROFUN_00393 [Planoprotostelium fungivorum]|uniref:COMM domain-containing protein n=1 Tax=Planoprotostelium fungivorum TaxID=1890364 RepID=A0A2P6NY93_9EUKA|nr:hypothetical protein PROFUN_00393 [Planoprotostelium fungivorum]
MLSISIVYNRHKAEGLGGKMTGGGADCSLTGGAGEELRWDSLGRNNEGEPAVDLPVEPERSCDGTRPQIAQSGRGKTIGPMVERGVHRRGKILRARFSYVPSRRFFTKAVDTPKTTKTQTVGRMKRLTNGKQSLQDTDGRNVHLWTAIFCSDSGVTSSETSTTRLYLIGKGVMSVHGVISSGLGILEMIRRYYSPTSSMTGRCIHNADHNVYLVTALDSNLVHNQTSLLPVDPSVASSTASSPTGFDRRLYTYHLFGVWIDTPIGCCLDLRPRRLLTRQYNPLGIRPKRFTTGEISPQIPSDFQRLNSVDPEGINLLTDAILSFISGQNPDLMDTLPDLSQGTRIPGAPLKSILQSLLFFFRGELRANASPTFVKEDLLSLGLESSRAAQVSHKWKEMFVTLSRSAIGQTLVVNQIVDMQWKFGVTASSNEALKVGSSYLQLKLTLDKGEGSLEHISMELTLPEFYQLYAEMQKAKANLEYFNT